MPDLSILIPSRNEMFCAQTVQNILENIRGDTEIILVLDGAWADPPIPVDARVQVIYHSQSIGQRAATNEAAKISTAKFIMKCDAHCAFDEGFDVKLMADCEYDWTVIPRMYNLHAFDWKCLACGNQTYQGPQPAHCEKCGYSGDEFERVIIWKPRLSRKTDFARFDKTLHFQYWGAYGKRPEAQGDIADVMCSVGACWFMHRERYWELGGLDEAHGSWGQMGVEIACKSWLSGGRQVVNKKTWFAHMFRTQAGFGFPYPNPGISIAREYSRQLWQEGKWEKAQKPLSWLIDKFAPVPDWDLAKGIVYYTDNRLDPLIMDACQEQIKHAGQGLHLTSVSLEPLVFGDNLHLPLERGILSMFKQILAGLEHSQADVIFLCEHDILYHPSHFEFIPPRDDAFYYNENTWKVDYKTGRALFYYTKQTSGLCAYRKLLVEHYRKRVERVERDGFQRSMGFEPGCHSFPRGVDNYPAERWMSPVPNLDIRHAGNLTPSRWRQDQFRNPKACLGWTEADEVPGWGVTRGRMPELMRKLIERRE